MANKHLYGVTIRDYSEETSRTEFNFGAVTALNIAGVLAQIGNLRSAIGGIILGVVAKDQWVGDRTVLDASAPSDTHAQVELKFQVNYHSNTANKKFRVEIPTADTSKVLPGTDIADLADSDIAAFVTAMETLCKSPDNDSEGVTVDNILLVGRNI